MTRASEDDAFSVWATFSVKQRGGTCVSLVAIMESEPRNERERPDAHAPRASDKVVLALRGRSARRAVTLRLLVRGGSKRKAVASELC